MTNIENAFNSFLNRKGKSVTILHYEGTPTKNNAGEEIPVTPEEISTKCRIIKKQAYENTQFGNVVVSGIYALGMFKFSDEDYLIEGNKVVDGNTTYEMKYMDRYEGHYEVILV